MSAHPIPVTVLGATGVVGQSLVAALSRHPDFRIEGLAASDRSAGRPYGEAAAWRLAEPLPADIAARVVLSAERDVLPDSLVFSALDAASARRIEPRLAEAGHWVFSNASAHRLEPDVPLVIPEVNASHLGLLPLQRRRRRWSGGLVANPNCSATQIALAVTPLHAAFGVEQLLVTTLQAASGAGHPGVSALDLLGNVVPDIVGEAAKIEAETPRILGRLERGRIVPSPMRVSARTFRVPVENGHTAAVSVRFARRGVGEDGVRRAWEAFRPEPDVARLSSAPDRPVVYVDGPHAPQPRRDASRGAGMTVSVGGLQRCGVLDWKFVVVGDNTVRGAAGACLMNAELCVARGHALSPSAGRTA